MYVPAKESKFAVERQVHACYNTIVKTAAVILPQAARGLILKRAISRTPPDTAAEREPLLTIRCKKTYREFVSVGTDNIGQRSINGCFLKTDRLP